MKRSLFVLAIVASLPFSLSAQGNSGGVKFGANFVSQKWDLGSFGSTTLSGTSFHIGLYGKYGIGGTAYIQPEIMYNSLKVTEDDADFSFNYVSIPLMFVYEFQPHFNVQAGPQLGILASTDPEELKEEDGVKGMDLSFNLGIGAEYKKASLTARYCIGLTNIAGEALEDEIDGISIKNNYFQISIGIRVFGGED